MNGTQGSGWFESGPLGGNNAGWPASGFRDAMDQLRGMFEQRVGPRMSKGDVRTAILALLTEQPMHGYQIIHEIEDRSGGRWKPSPGSVYPTLQMLADEDLITAEESGGKKTYTLTEAGRAEAESAEGSAPWESSSASARGFSGFGSGGAIPKSGMALAQAATQVARTGTPEQVTEAVAVLDEARRKLYAILAKD